MNTIGKVNFGGFDCMVQKSNYLNGKTLLRLLDLNDYFPIATATVNISEVELNENEILIKNHSENEGMLETLEKAGIVKDTGKSVRIGFVKIPIAELLIGIS